jgi:hypothetical protein
MDSVDLDKLRQKYSRISDEEIRELLLAGKDEFEPDAFNLLLDEARKRQVEIGTEIAASQKDEPEAQALEKELEQESYAELAVVNSPEDAESIRTRLSGTGINFYFQPISYSGKELPVALLVQQSRAEEAIEKLKDLSPKAAIFLW